MEHFTFALNATLPIFLLILLGWFLQRIGLLNQAFSDTANQYVFRCALPISLFQSMREMNLTAEFDLRFCLFCFLVTTVMFLGVWGLTWILMKDRSLIGAFSQASVRSSAGILGIAMAESIYGTAGMVPIMIMAAVPFFNAYSVLILTFSPHVDETGRLLPPSLDGTPVRTAFLHVITNPIILGVLLGIPFSLLSFPVPHVLNAVLTQIAHTTTPIALLVVGASFTGIESLRHWKPSVLATLIKLFLLPGIFLPLAALLGFRQSALVAILIMVGGPTTVSCYVMAKQMGGNTCLTAQTVAFSTLVSSLSITLWIFLLRWFSLI